MRRTARWILVATLSLAIGLQWAAVQGAAWVGMMIGFSKENSLARAVAMTFNGRHPCKLCHAAQEGESSTKKQDADRGIAKIDLAAPTPEPMTFSGGESAPGGSVCAFAARRAHSPPSPPPEAA